MHVTWEKTLNYVLIVMYFHVSWKNTHLAPLNGLRSKFLRYKFKIKKSKSILRRVLGIKQMECRKALRHGRTYHFFTKPLKMLICFTLTRFCISKLHRRASLYESKIQISLPFPPNPQTDQFLLLVFVLFFGTIYFCF